MFAHSYKAEPVKLKNLRLELENTQANLNRVETELVKLRNTQGQLDHLYHSEKSTIPSISLCIGGLSLFFQFCDYEGTFKLVPLKMAAAAFIFSAPIEHGIRVLIKSFNPNLSNSSKQTLLQIVDEFKLDALVTDNINSISTVANKVREKIELGSKLEEKCSLAVESCSKAVAEEEKQYEEFVNQSFEQFRKKKTDADAKDEPVSVAIAIPSKRF